MSFPAPSSVPAVALPMKTVYVSFYSQISEVSANKFMAACAEIMRVDQPDCLYFLFASAGGGMSNRESQCITTSGHWPVKIVMHNTGAIDSIANVIFHAADERHANPYSTFHFHGVAMNLEKGALRRSQLQELLSQLDALETKIENILVGRCSLSSAEIKDLFLNGESKDTAFAMSKGIIQTVSQAAIPPNAKFYSLNFT